MSTARTVSGHRAVTKSHTVSTESSATTESTASTVDGLVPPDGIALASGTASTTSIIVAPSTSTSSLQVDTSALTSSTNILGHSKFIPTGTLQSAISTGVASNKSGISAIAVVAAGGVAGVFVLILLMVFLIVRIKCSWLFEKVSPPTGQVTIVFTDIRNSTHLSEANPGMATAMRLHNSLLRRQLRFCGGYEVKTEGDAAVWWCLSVQRQLLEESWPLEILECEDGKSIYDSDEHLIARGLSVRMGIHSGMPLCETDPITHRMDYFGPMVNRSARIKGCALGGQIMCSSDIILEINATSPRL